MNYQRMAIEKEAPEEVGVAVKYNLSESAISDQTLRSLSITIPLDTVLTYTEHKGSSKIRSLVAQASKGDIDPEDVLVTAGASTSLFIIHSALLSAKDHVVITRPNYATNLEVPRAIGCDMTCIDLDFESQYRLDIGRISAAVRPGVTKLISICSPNNPTGTMHTGSELRALADLAKGTGCYLVVDETYAELRYASHPPGESDAIPAAASLGNHVVGVSSMSKAYGVPGIRVGWLTTTNTRLQEAFLAAKEQISICGSSLDELCAEQILSRRNELIPATMADMQRRRERIARWIAEESEWLDWVRPEAGVMCFVKIKKEPLGGFGAFYKTLLEDHGVYIGRGGWFESHDSFFRLGYGWPTWQELEEGLVRISKVLRA